MPLADIVLTDAPNGCSFIPVASVPLVVEAAETALDFLMGAKARLHAKHGVLECSVVDLQGRVVQQMWSPNVDGYAQQHEVAFGDQVESTAVPGLRVDTGGLA